MASRRFLCRMGRHECTQRKSEDGQPLMLGGQALEACRHCDAVRERPGLGEMRVGAVAEAATWAAEAANRRLATRATCLTRSEPEL